VAARAKRRKDEKANARVNKDENVNIRVTSEQKAELVQAATHAGSSWMLAVALREARRTEGGG